jgi:hypothetical protein
MPEHYYYYSEVQLVRKRRSLIYQDKPVKLIDINEYDGSRIQGPHLIRINKP